METIEFPFMVLLRNAPAGMFAYAPKAPFVKIQKSEYGILLEELALAVQPWLPPQVICIRFDTLWKSPYGNALTASETPRIQMLEWNWYKYYSENTR